MSVAMKVRNVNVLFTTLLEEEHSKVALEFVRKHKRDGPSRVLFLGSIPLTYQVETIRKLKDEGFHVIARTNDDWYDGAHRGPTNDIRDSLRKYIREGSQQIRDVLGDDAGVSHRGLHPACCSLVNLNEFADAICIIAEWRAGVLMACAKALGIMYSGSDGDATFTRDAGLLDTPCSRLLDLSPLGKLLLMALQNLPGPVEPRAEPDEHEKAEVFRLWIEAVQGNHTSRASLITKILGYRADHAEAERLAGTAMLLFPGVLFVDTISSTSYDHVTLCDLLDATGCEAYVIRRRVAGPNTAQCRVEYFLVLTVVRHHSIMADLLIGGIPPGSGIVVNDEDYELVASAEAWESVVLPALKALYNSPS